MVGSTRCDFVDLFHSQISFFSDWWKNLPHDEQMGWRIPIDLMFDIEHRDWALQWFVGICNISGVEIPITLNLGGCYVSGYIVKPDVFFDGVNADLQGGTFHGPAGNEVKKMLEQTLSDMRKLFAPLAAEGEDERSRKFQPRYIHLRAARFFAANDLSRPFPGLPRGAWWRGKIAAVDGFQIGMPFPV